MASPWPEQVSSRPVEQVSWDMVQRFLAGTGMRLPTEAEWERAYRAGTGTAYHSLPGYPGGTNDEVLLAEISWFLGNSAGQTRPVGQKAGNGFGLHDMNGNVMEWTDDIWHPNYNGAPTDGSAWVEGGDATQRVMRGGAMDLDPKGLRSASRSFSSRVYRNQNTGLRVVRAP